MDTSSLSYPAFSPPPGESHPSPDLLAAYRLHLSQERGLLDPDTPVKVAKCFLHRLEACHRRIEDLTPAQIHAFVTEQGSHYQRRTVATIASFLRVFLRYLTFIGRLSDDLSLSVRRPCMFHGEREPRYLQDWQLRQILASTDRDSLKGKRDYAILLLLSVYGLRAKEVALLKLDDLRWTAGKMRISSRKCADAVELPLVGDVALALTEYLRVRPVSEAREVFLSVFRPNSPLKACAVWEIARKAIRRGGITIARPGSHTYRYSRAQAMFAAEKSLPEIAATLGHRDLRTTLGYLSFTVHPLREVALNAGEELA